MSAKSKKPNKEKELKRQERMERREHLTNWYMLNLTYGILGIIVLMILGSCYKRSATVAHMQTAMWIVTAVLAVGAVALFAFGKTKDRKRAVNYSVVLLICAVFALWLALYNKIRPIMESAARAILRNPNLAVNSYWNTRLPIIAIAIYLVVSFIVYAVKVSKK